MKTPYIHVHRQMKNVKLFLLIWGLFLFGITICLSAFTVSKIINDKKITDAQVEQIGKPTRVEWNQFYHNNSLK